MEGIFMSQAERNDAKTFHKIQNTFEMRQARISSPSQQPNKSQKKNQTES